MNSTPIRCYRDDGPLAVLAGRGGGSGVLGSVTALTSTAVGVAVALAALGMDPWPRLAVVCWCVLAAGLAAGRSHDGRLDWLAPPLLRVQEYGYVAVVGLAGGVPPALVFASLGALAYHHYDIAYRIRQRVRLPPPWLGRLALGWDGRTLAVALAAAVGTAAGTAGVLTGVVAVLTALLWPLFVAESVVVRMRSPGAGTAGVTLDE